MANGELLKFQFVGMHTGPHTDRFTPLSARLFQILLHCPGLDKVPLTTFSMIDFQ